jgi:23S rRNA pseudouridine1911/1915/1917 synthase
VSVVTAQTNPRVLTTDRGDAGQRIDLVLRRHLSDVSAATRTRIQQWIANGDVRINDMIVRRVATRTAAGDVLTVRLPLGALRLPLAAEQRPLDILYEDDCLLALAKPPGIVVHPTHAHRAGTLMNALAWHAREWPAGQRPSLVGRLDKLTSGVVLVAKTSRLHAVLQRSLASPAADKSYHAIVYGAVEPSQGEIALALGRDAFDRRRVVASAGGAPSVTRFERIAHVPARPVGLTLLRCGLVTGRTHQLRVHLAARGWPIAGDPVYGEPRWKLIEDSSLAHALSALPRQALHATSVSLPHPVTGKRLLIVAPFPRDLHDVCVAAGLPAGAATA